MSLILTPAIKGQLTKASHSGENPRIRYSNIRHVFQRHMPREQAKHATRKFLAGLRV